MRPPQDVHIRRWMEQDYQPAAGVITAAYRDHIDSEINDQYRTNAGSMRFLNNIVRFPGCGVFDAESSFVAVHQPTNALIGLILCSRVQDDVGHVTQVCLVPEYRRTGHRREALSPHLQCAAQAQLQFAVPDRDRDANHRAVDLYRQLGLRREARLRCVCVGRVRRQLSVVSRQFSVRRSCNLEYLLRAARVHIEPACSTSDAGRELTTDNCTDTGSSV